MAIGLTLRGTSAVPARERAAGRPGFFRRILTAMQEAQLRRAEQEIARYIEAHGGTLTDQVEREIEIGILRRY